MRKARDLANIISGGFTADDIPNLDAAKITSGTFADARIAASNVSQHAQSFDDNKIVNDISTLALRQASNENKAAYNTNSMYVDVFQDATGITNLTNVSRDSNEFVFSGSSSTGADTNLQVLLNADTGLTDQSSNNISITNNGVSVSTSQAKFGTQSFYFDGSDYLQMADNSRWRYNPTNWTWECWFYLVSNTNSHDGLFGQNNSNNTKQNIFQFVGSPTNTLRHQSDGYGIEAYFGTINTGQWYHIANVGNASTGYVDVYVDGVKRSTTDGNNDNTINLSDSDVDSAFWIGNRNYDGSTNHTIAPSYWDSIRISNTVRYSGSSFTVPTSRLSPNIVSASATGNFTCPNITAPSSDSKMGAIITYQDTHGTNALNTDIVLQISADGGSNYATATLTAMPDFATGIKMAKVNDLSVTAGTSLKYKISFANQSNSKNARIRGVSLQY